MSGINLNEADRHLAAALASGEGRLRVTELANDLRLDASSWVGVVRFSDIEVRVVPKLVGGNLGVLRMLEYSSGLGALARLESARTLAAERDGSLVDLLGLLLAEASLAIAKSGILQDYVTHEAALGMVRGRLLAYEQLTRRYGRIDQLECRFDELETDIAENQILAAALAIARRVCQDPEARRLTARAHAIFSEVADAGTIAPGEPPAFDYNRRNGHYESAHVIARMFLQNLAVNDLYSPGEGESFAFLLDMNRLFEDFVTRLLQNAFAGSPVRVRPQRRDRTLITDARTGRPYAAVIPDLLLEWRDGGILRQLPIDAKYKLYDERKIDQGDIYQTFFYAWAYADHATESDARAFIVYPGDAASAGTRLLARARDGDRGASIRALAIDVPAMLDAIRQNVPIHLSQIAEAVAA